MNTARVQLKRIWNKVKGVLPKRRWLLVMLVIFGGLVIAGSFGGIRSVLAGADTPGFWISLFAKICFGIAGLFMQIAIFFLNFFIDLAKYNNYINADVVKLGWLMVRDVCNMFFVMILLVIAIGTILGIEQYEWKKTLVKFVLAAVLINFSKMIFGLIIDVAHVFTITFLNAVAAIAGGNLITMFKFDKMMKMIGEGVKDNESLDLQIFVSSILALVFTGTAMVAIGAYTIVMVARVVVLWVLIILSPLAFVLQVIPQTQAYAKQIWDKFGKQVMVAPVMVFFLWLSFATLGSGDVATKDLGIQESTYSEANGVKVEGGNALSISEVGTWENVSSFLVAIAFLLVGLQVVQGMGVVAGGLVQKAQDFAGSVAKIATGYAVGRKIAGATVGGLAKAGKAAAWYAPVIGGEKWSNLGKTIWANVKTGYYRKASGITQEAIKKTEQLGQSRVRLEEIDQRLAKGGLTNEERKKLEIERGELGGKGGKVETLQKEIAGIAGKGGGVIGWIARAGVSQEKHLKKSQGQLETMQKIAFKHIGAEAGGWVFNRPRKDVSAQDRIERGILQAAEMRSKAKDEEFEARGKFGVLAMPRQRYTKRGFSDWEAQEKKGTILDQIARHKRAAGRLGNWTKALEQGAELRIDVNAQKDVEGVLGQIEKIELETMSPRQLVLVQQTDQAEINAKAVEVETERQYQADNQAIERQIEDPTAGYNGNVIDLATKLEAYRRDKKEIDEKTPENQTRKQKIEGDTEKKKEEMSDYMVESEKELAGVGLDINSLQEQRAAAIKNGTYNKRGLIADGEFVEDKKGDQTRLQFLELQIEEKSKEFKSKQEDRGKNIETRSNEISELIRSSGYTDEEARIMEELNLARKDRDASPEVAGLKTQQEKLKIEKDKKQAAEYVKVKEAKNDLDNYLASPEQQAYKSSPGYAVKRAMADKEIAAAEDTLRTLPGIGGFIADLEAKKAEQAAKAARGFMEVKALGLRGVDEMFSTMHVEEQLAQAAEKFKDKIKDAHLGDIFEKGAKKLEEAAKNIEKGMSYKEAHGDLSAGAIAIKAEVEGEYSKDLSGTARQHIKDLADSQYSYERFGFKTPATAYKSLIKKRMDNTFQGVEREQAVLMAFGSLQKLNNLQQKGGKLSIDQTAQMMANVNYLTKQAWSDDLLAKIVDVINDIPKMKEGSKEKEEAQSLAKIFVDDLKWGERDEKGNAKIKDNISSGSRTNDMHRLIAMNANISALQAENAVLRYKRSNGVDGQDLGYHESVEKLSSSLSAVLKGKSTGDVRQEEWETMAQRFGIFGDRGADELKHFYKEFVEGAKDASQALDKFKSNMNQYSEANELLTDFKNLAVANAHLDDGGHTYYDLKDGVARGMLYDDAVKFLISDWVKVDGSKRLSSLKIHSLAEMDETYGTASHFDPLTWAATFEGVISKIMLQRLDVRNQKLIVKLGSKEEVKKDAEGNFMVGHIDSTLLKDKYGGKTKEAFADIAKDWAVALNTHPEVLLALLGNQSGVTYENALAGELKIAIGSGTGQETKIKDINELMKWIIDNGGKDVKLDEASILNKINKNRVSGGQGATELSVDRAFSNLLKAQEELKGVRVKLEQARKKNIETEIKQAEEDVSVYEQIVKETENAAKKAQEMVLKTKIAKAKAAIGISSQDKPSKNITQSPSEKEAEDDSAI